MFKRTMWENQFFAPGIVETTFKLQASNQDLYHPNSADIISFEGRRHRINLAWKKDTFDTV